jgi:TonB family protein
LGAGFASGLLVYASIFVAVSLISLLNLSMPESGVVAISDPYPLNEVNILLPTIRVKTEKNQAKSGTGSLGGSLTQPQRPHGGGGGNDLRRTSRGVPPPPPSPEPPVIEHSTLIIKPTVNVDPKSLPMMKGQIGMLDSPPDAPPSRGPGHGNGIGPGKDDGYGPGEGGVGGGPHRPGGGPPNGCCGDAGVMSETLRPTILYREKAKYTEDARQHKVEGTVVLAIVFGADGRIHDIRTVRGLPDGLTETSIEAAQKIRFHPAVQNGKPVSVRATLEFSFALY